MYVFILLLFLSTLICGEFHTVFNFIHSDPCIFDTVFDFTLPNYVYLYCDNSVHYIDALHSLEESAFVHIERMVERDCPFMHDTCRGYCNLYGSCSFDKRIEYYVGKKEDIFKIGEVLLSSSSLDILDILYKFVNSQGHGKAILDKDYNYYGFSMYDNLVNINLIQKKESSKSDFLSLQPTNVTFNNFVYTFTTIQMNGMLVYNNSNMYIYKNILDE